MWTFQTFLKITFFLYLPRWGHIFSPTRNVDVARKMSLGRGKVTATNAKGLNFQTKVVLLKNGKTYYSLVKYFDANSRLCFSKTLTLKDSHFKEAFCGAQTSGLCAFVAPTIPLKSPKNRIDEAASVKAQSVPLIWQYHQKDTFPK